MYEQILKLPVDGIYMEGNLTLPVKAKSLVIFAQGSGEFSSEYETLARHLQQNGFGTLLFQLSNEKEESHQKLGIPLLAQRLVALTLWISSHSEYSSLDLAYLGGGRGAAVALKAAAVLSSTIRAVICCGGRTDLVSKDLKKVICPTLLITGELDFHTIKLNKQAMKLLGGTRQIAIIAGASHLFEEPGKLDLVAKDAIAWLEKYLRVGETVPEEELDSLELESYEEK